MKLLLLTAIFALSCAPVQEVSFEGFHKPVVCQKNETEDWICSMTIQDFLLMMRAAQNE